MKIRSYITIAVLILISIPAFVSFSPSQEVPGVTIVGDNGNTIESPTVVIDKDGKMNIDFNGSTITGFAGLILTLLFIFHKFYKSFSVELGAFVETKAKPIVEMAVKEHADVCPAKKFDEKLDANMITIHKRLDDILLKMNK